jgi:hypothetical protein
MSKPVENRVRKERGHYRLGDAYISFLIQSGANLAQTFTKAQQKQKKKKNYILLQYSVL